MNIQMLSSPISFIEYLIYGIGDDFISQKCDFYMSQVRLYIYNLIDQNNGHSFSFL